MCTSKLQVTLKRQENDTRHFHGKKKVCNMILIQNHRAQMLYKIL